MKTGIEIISDERKSHFMQHGYTIEGDIMYTNNELVRAAICYAMEPDNREAFNDDGNIFDEGYWPWSEESFKPHPDDRIKELAKAGALIAAEIDRLQFPTPPQNVEKKINKP